MTISVFLVEDNRLVREGIAALLGQQPGVTVLGGRANDDAGAAGAVVPDVVLLDIGLRNGDSLKAAQKVRRDFPASRVVVMDLLMVHEDLLEFVNAGVSGFVVKDATVEELVKTVRLVAGGTPVLPRQMTGTLFSQITQFADIRGPSQAPRAVRITPREQQVVGLIAQGLSNKEIAARLPVAIRTVKSHIRNIMEKLALRTRLQIAAFAHRDENGSS